MSHNPQTDGLSRALAGLLVALLTLSGWSWIHSLSKGLSITNELHALVPGSNLQQEALQANLNKAFGNKVLVSIRAGDREHFDAALDVAIEQISTSNLITFDTSAEASFEALVTDLLPLRHQLMSPVDRQNVATGQLSSLHADLKSFMYGIPLGVRWTPFKDDPYNLFARMLTYATADLSINKKWSGEWNGTFFEGAVGQESMALIPLTPAQSEQGFDSVAEFETWFAQFTTAVKSVGTHEASVHVLGSSALFHIAHASRSAQREVTLFSIISVMGIVGLFLWVFGAGWPLLLTALSLVVGCFTAVGVALAVYDNVHVIALVFGCSLIGIGVDYAFHFVCMGGRERYLGLRSASALALVSSGTAYAALLQSDIVVIGQIALLSSVGLLACWVFVVVVFPKIFIQPAWVRTPRAVALSRLLMGLHGSLTAKQLVLALLALTLLCVILLAMLLRFDSSVNSLYQANPQLVNNDREIGQFTQNYSPSRYLIVQDESAERLLNKLESMRPELERLKGEGAIQGYQLLTDLFPPGDTRAINRQLNQGLYGLEGEIHGQIKLQDDALKSLAARVDQNISHDAHIHALASQHFPHIWLGELAGSYYASVPLLQPSAAVTAYWPKGVRFIDQPVSWSHSLNKAAMQALVVFLGASILVGGIVLLWIRKVASLIVVLVPVVASLTTLSALTLAGIEISLFHVFGLYLVVGLGFDYGVFVLRDNSDASSCFLAILMSAATTLLAFGLLSQSATPMISSFGTTVLCGTLLNLIFVPGIRSFRGRL